MNALPPNMSSKILLQPCPVPELPGDCWVWHGAIQSRGYGSFDYQGRRWSTHRLAYELLVGPIPDGLQVDHVCKVKRCCNPEHLEPVTGKVNCERTDAATKTRCVHDHPLVPPNLSYQDAPEWPVDPQLPRVRPRRRPAEAGSDSG
jgi:hypothetical protein